MEVVRKGQTPEGVAIQIENWKENYKGIITTISIGAYPKAKNYGPFVRLNQPFRVDIARGFASDKEVEETFVKLENGEISIESLSERFWDKNSSYYLGLTEDVKEETFCKRGGAYAWA